MAKIIRKELRRHLVYYLRVVDPVTGQLIGRLVDITPLGMMLVSASGMAPGQDFDLRLMLPAELDGPEYLDVRGQVVWCQKDVNPEYFAVGLKFADTSETAHYAILDLIDGLGFKD